MRNLWKGFVAVALGVVAIAVAEEAAQAAKKEAVVKEGTLVCVGCHLEKQHGAEAQCSLYAKHAQGLLASDGTLWTILDNSRGHYFVTEKKLLGKPIRVHGFAFPKAQVLEAHRYDLKEGEAWVAYDFCRDCGWEKGDHKGKDLCEDCEKGK